MKIILIEGRFHQHDGGQAAGYVDDFFHLVRGQGAAQEGLFPVGEPLLDDLVAADVVVPDLLGDVPPVGPVVQVNVIGGLPQVLQGLLRGEAQGLGALPDTF